VPSTQSIEIGEIRIISKIGFDTGKIEFRSDTQTKTKMIGIQPGDLVISGINVAKGAIAIYSENEKKPAAATIHYSAYEARNDKVDKVFLWWLLRSNVFRDILARNLPGGIKTELKAKRLLPIQIPLPPLSEQRRIVEKIERLAASVEEAMGLTALVDDLVGNLAVSLHLQLSGQRLVEIGTLLDLDEDKQQVKPHESYPQVGIRGFGGGLFRKPEVSGADTTYRYFNRIKFGQVVLSQVKGWEGAISVCPQELDGFFASPEYRTFTCKRGISDPAYLDHLFRTPWFHKMLGNATRGQGARRERTRPELFLKIELPMPQYEEQRKAAKILNQVSEIRVMHNRSHANLDAMLPSILDRAFKGEL
jgi:type I restriction enzyme S subunit